VTVNRAHQSVKEAAPEVDDALRALRGDLQAAVERLVSPAVEAATVR
jgi:hypothetical protein